MKHITLHVTRQEADSNGRRKVIRVKVADTDVPQTQTKLLDNVSRLVGIRNIPLLLTHALSIGGDNVASLLGFDYLFDQTIFGEPTNGGFLLGVEVGFHYVFEPTDDPNVFGFYLDGVQPPSDEITIPSDAEMLSGSDGALTTIDNEILLVRR